MLAKSRDFEVHPFNKKALSQDSMTYANWRRFSIGVNFVFS